MTTITIFPCPTPSVLRSGLVLSRFLTRPQLLIRLYYYSGNKMIRPPLPPRVTPDAY
jgi:hypothetical protein